MDTHTKVQQFLELIGITPGGYPEPPTQEGLNEGYIHGLSNNTNSSGFVADMKKSIPIIPEDIIGKQIGKGGLGAIYICRRATRTCIKEIIIKDDDINPDKTFLNIIKECFIQFFLSKDEVYGHYIPKLTSIYQRTINTGFRTKQFSIFIEMEQLDEDVLDKIQKNFGNKEIDLSNLKALIIDIFTPLSYFNQTYNYVHRDFKLNNIMIKNTGNNTFLYKFIDFGFSCMTINLGGNNYVIKSTVAFPNTTPCRGQQDVLFFLYFIYTYLNPKLDDDARNFIANFIPNDLLNELRRKPVNAPFHAAYNYYNTLIGNNKKRQHKLSIQTLLAAAGAENPAQPIIPPIGPIVAVGPAQKTGAVVGLGEMFKRNFVGRPAQPTLAAAGPIGAGRPAQPTLAAAGLGEMFKRNFAGRPAQKTGDVVGFDGALGEMLRNHGRQLAAQPTMAAAGPFGARQQAQPTFGARPAQGTFAAAGPIGARQQAQPTFGARPAQGTFAAAGPIGAGRPAQPTVGRTFAQAAKNWIRKQQAEAQVQAQPTIAAAGPFGAGRPVQPTVGRTFAQAAKNWIRKQQAEAQTQPIGAAKKTGGSRSRKTNRKYRKTNKNALTKKKH
jgi:hypothetical protein